MTDSPTNAKSIFGQALEIATPDDRARYLDEACRGDAALRSEVDGLLQAHQAAGGFLAEPAAAPECTAAVTAISEGPGTRIGHYKLLQEIGQGGFGAVFMAEQQEPVRRMVALKIIKPGMDTRAVVARFEAERQALALMDHPNIARVFDGGVTDSGPSEKGDRSDRSNLCEAPGGPSRQIGPVPFSAGRPYFVMELVKGVPITAFCDKNNSPTEERLRLFIDVCRAVQHAHQKGVIHRDLKPSNIMVTLHDGVPVAKVIDFGVAKALSQRLTEKTLFTAYGQMIGTPLYMSPEQAEMSALDVDTRSDIYSLGVLLYELLTGCTPLEAAVLRDAGYAEMQRLIRETEPPRPSVRLSTSGQRLTEIAQHRSIDPKALRRLVAGELDWIVMKALEKDRRRRYETATAFAADVERFLRQEPVEAGPPTAGYRLRKFVARRKSIFATLTAIAVTLLLGSVGTTTGWISAIKWAQHSEKEAQLARSAEAVALRAKAAAESTLAKLQVLLLDRAFLFAMIGDVERTKAAVEDAEVAEIPLARRELALGMAHFWRGEKDLARRHMSAAREREPQSCAINDAYAMLLLGDDYKAYLSAPRLEPRTDVDYLFRTVTEAWVHPSVARETMEQMGIWKGTAYAHWVRAFALANSSLETGDSKHAEAALQEAAELRARVREENAVVLTCELYVLHVSLCAANRIGQQEKSREYLARATEAAKKLENHLSTWFVIRGRAAFNFAFGDRDDAVRDCTRLIQTKPSATDPMLFAACMYRFGERDLGLHLLRASATSDNPYWQIAECHLLSEDKAQKPNFGGLDPVKLAQSPNSDPACAALGAWLLAGRPEVAREKAAAILSLTDFERDPRYKLVLQYLAGESDESQLRKRFQDVPGPRVLYPDVDYYIGLVQLVDGHRQQAKQSFERCVEKGVFAIHEHLWARAILARMEDPSWPTWTKSPNGEK